MKNRIKLIFLFFTFFFMVFQGFSILKIDYLDKIPITGYFINPAQYSSFYPDLLKKTYDQKEIENKIEENQQLIANLLLTGISFVHRRSMKSKGFELSTEFKKEFLKYELIPYSITSENGYYVTKTSLVTITDYIRKRVKRSIDVNGILIQGEASLSFFENIDTIENITSNVLYEAIKECIVNAALKTYGNNYIFEINGYFHLVEPVEYRFAGSLVYSRIKGYVIFYYFTR